MADNCANCRFWAEPGSETVYGECRKQEPGWVNQGWPRTTPTAWCGAWRRRWRSRQNIHGEGRNWEQFIRERRVVSNDTVFNPGNKNG